MVLPMNCEFCGAARISAASDSGGVSITLAKVSSNDSRDSTSLRNVSSSPQLCSRKEMRSAGVGATTAQKDFFDSFKSIKIHRQCVGTAMLLFRYRLDNSCNSQVRANRQSCFTVSAEIFKTVAISSWVSPPKYLSSTTRLLRSSRNVSFRARH